MRNGLLLLLAFGSAAGIAHGQMPYPGMTPGYAPMPAPGAAMYPQPGYAPPAAYQYPYYPPAWPAQPNSAYYPPTWQQPVAGPYNPYPVAPRTVTAKSSPACDATPPSCGTPCEPMVCPPPAPAAGPSCPDNGTATNSRTHLGSCMEPLWAYADKVRTYFDRPPPNLGPEGYPWYGRTEVLYFWMQGQSIPGSTNLGSTGNSIAVPGYAAVSLNSVIPYYNDIIAASHLGGRFTLGRWLDEDQYWGLEATVWSVYQAPQPNYASGGPTAAPSAAQISSTAGLLGISQPQASALLTTFSGKNTVGTISGLGSGELNLRHEFCRSANGHVDVLFGFRTVDLAEAMAAINTQDTVLIQSQNLFLGGQVGLEGEFDYRRLFINGWGKIALGNNHETASAGTTAAAAGGTVSSFSSFVGNDGSISRNQFIGVGEAGLAVGYQIGCHCRVFTSYTIVYLTDVARPSSQIGNFLGTSASNMLGFSNSSFWAQGVSVGLEFRF